MFCLDHPPTPADFAAQAPSGSAQSAPQPALRLREPVRYTQATLISTGT